MTPLAWPCPRPDGTQAPEYALAFEDFRRWRLLVVPALFDEANRMRRFTVEVMRRLDGAGVDSFLIDLPGCNESLALLEDQTADSWRDAVAAAAAHFRASHVLALRGGALLTPADLPGWRYAPANGAALLRTLLRARLVASREAGVTESLEGLTQTALRNGIELAGYRLGSGLFRDLQALTPPLSPLAQEIDQDMLGGSGLWLRAEPDEDRAQADALAAIVAIGIKA